MIQAITRFVFVTAGLLGGYAVTRVVDWQTELGLPRYYVIFLFIILGAAIGYVLGGIVGRELTARVAPRRRRASSRLAGADLVLGNSRPRRRPPRRVPRLAASAAARARMARHRRHRAADVRHGGLHRRRRSR